MSAATASRSAPSSQGEPFVPSATRDIVVYGTTDWEGAWLTEHNLAAALAEMGCRVLFVEPAITPLAPFRYGLGRGTVEKLRRLTGPRLSQRGRVHVLRPLALPPREHPAARRASAPFLRAQVGRAVRRVGLRAPVVLAAVSTFELEGAAGESAVAFLVKDLVEAGAGLIGRDAGELEREVSGMCARADVVFAISPALRAHLADRGVDGVLLPHGFHVDLAPRYDESEPPNEYLTLPRPIVTYAGRIDGRLDLSVLAALADGLGGGSLALVGPVSPRLDRAQLDRLAAHPAVHLLGPRQRVELPPYLVHADCLLLPYREDEWSRHGSPLKLWDYLYAGPPLVGSGYTVLRDYPPPLVNYTEGGEAFAAAVAEALAAPAAGRERRRALARANGWDVRAREFLAALDERGLGADPRRQP